MITTGLQYEADPRDIQIVEEGDYLLPLIEKTKNVLRFVDSRYPEGMVSEKLLSHIIKCIHIAKSLQLDNETIAAVIRTLLVHDLPEIETGDITAVIKQEKGLAIYDDEAPIARKVLNDDDYFLYCGFRDASNYLEGKWDDVVVLTSAGLIARVVDAIEGGMYFHFCLSKWVKAGQDGLPHEGALVHTFESAKTFRENIIRLGDDDLKEFLLSLIDCQMEYIQSLWKEIDAPPIIAERLV